MDGISQQVLNSRAQWFATRSNEELINSSNNDYLFDRKISIRTIQHLIKINQLIKQVKK